MAMISGRQPTCHDSWCPADPIRWRTSQPRHIWGRTSRPQVDSWRVHTVGPGYILILANHGRFANLFHNNTLFLVLQRFVESQEQHLHSTKDRRKRPTALYSRNIGHVTYFPELTGCSIPGFKTPPMHHQSRRAGHDSCSVDGCSC